MTRAEADEMALQVVRQLADERRRRCIKQRAFYPLMERTQSNLSMLEMGHRDPSLAFALQYAVNSGFGLGFLGRLIRNAQIPEADLDCIRPDLVGAHTRG